MLSYDKIVEEVIEWYNETPIKLQFDFKTANKKELAEYHYTLGRDIRNHFGLWEKDWVPELVDGVDCSPNHPDQISMNIIEEVWRRVNAS